MRLKIEATPEELVEKSDVLIKALAEAVSIVAPDLAEQLEKSVRTPVEMRQPALRDIHKITRKEYQKRLDWMVRDIGKVLDRAVMKKADETDPDEDQDELEPGDVDPETGKLVPEEDEEESDEEEEAE